MRFTEKSIIFDDDITEGSDWYEITGYMWATDSLCEIAEYKGELDTEDYINLEKHHKGLRKQFDKYHKALEEIKGTIKHFKTYFSEQELNKVKFSDITVIEEIITETIGG